MTLALLTQPNPVATSSSIRSGADFVVSQSDTMSEHLSSIFEQARLRNYSLPANTTKRLVERHAQAVSLDERLFSSLVSLKVAVSQYAMHLSADERHRIFDELDSKLNVDDWHADDQLPNSDSFKDFLKWMIHSKHFRWTSIGVSAQGSIQVAWRTPRVMLTANFEAIDSVRWTAQLKSKDGEVGHSVGKCTLRLFAEQALFYLKESSDGEIKNYK